MVNPDTTESLFRERDMLRNELASWWKRWRALHPDDPDGKLLMDLDTWAKESPDETKERIGA